MVFIAPRVNPYKITSFHCALVTFRKLGRLKMTRMIAERAILNEEVAAAPKTGNMPFAIAAPPWKLTIASNTASTAGNSIPFLFVIVGLPAAQNNHSIANRWQYKVRSQNNVEYY